nr:MAG TPA: hypothetical protein [Caudoviricetes sp.]
MKPIHSQGSDTPGSVRHEICVCLQKNTGSQKEIRIE